MVEDARMKTLLEEVKGFDPYNEQEEADKELLMTDVYKRQCMDVCITIVEKSY